MKVASHGNAYVDQVLRRPAEDEVMIVSVLEEQLAEFEEERKTRTARKCGTDNPDGR